ncbi:DUF2264 domain-containing protein [Bacteroidales bacterium OttesenSCG-928-M11]|nr:DUF2264 domain-containing protein [Bacteroidales bacterium OttesenSCG-928-M11]
MKCMNVKVCLLISVFVLSLSGINAQNVDRKYWTDLAYKMSQPILSNMAKGELKKNMNVELSPIWDNRNIDVVYLETFGRLMSGIAPWLSLPDDNTPEGKQRKQLREWALLSCRNAVDPNSPDYINWKASAQILVDASYLAQAFLRAPEQLWEPLDDQTKERFVSEFKGLRRYLPAYNNWLLFPAMVETFLLSIGEDYDAYRIDIAIRKMEEWYESDGWYADGPHFAFDYYNGYAIQPMYLEIVQTLLKTKRAPRVNTERVDIVTKRIQRYSHFLERMISPEGTFPVFGRSMTYRLAVFQPLMLLALQENMPKQITEGQVRAGVTAAMKNMFSVEGNFDKDGYLQLGFAGHQPELADYYTNNGSLYITSLVFLPLGLSADHSFWTSEPEDWTSRKAWSGRSFPKDYATRLK